MGFLAQRPEKAHSRNLGVAINGTKSYAKALGLNKRPFDETANPHLKMLRFPYKFSIIPKFLFLILINAKKTFIFETPRGQLEMLCADC